MEAKRFFGKAFRWLTKMVRKPHRIKKYLFAILPYHLSRLINGYASFPISITIQINSKCNLKCKMCDVGTKNDKSMYYQNTALLGELPVEEWKRFISEVAVYKPSIFISSLEPLLYKDIIEIIDFIVNKKKLVCEMNTNGFLLENYAKELVDVRLQRIDVSLDGPEKIHEEIRGVAGSFAKTISGIKKVLEFRKNKKNPQVNIFYTISNFNYHCLDETVKMLEENRIDYDQLLFAHILFIDEKLSDINNALYPEFYTTPINCSGIDVNEIKIDKLQEEILKVKKRSYKKNIVFFPDLDLDLLEKYYFKSDEFIHGKKRCTIPWFMASIQADGEIVVLPRCYGMKFGNIKSDSLKNIWNSEKFRKFRVTLKKNGAFPACSRCCGTFQSKI